MGKVLKGQRLLRQGDKRKATKFDAPEFKIRSAHMTRTNEGASVMFYDAEIVGANNNNIVNIIGDTTIRVLASNATLNSINIIWVETIVEIPLSSYKYILVDADGNVILNDYYIENYVILAIVATTSTTISKLTPFMSGGLYLIYKRQSLVDGSYKWTVGDETHIIGGGERARFTYDESGKIATLLYIKNGQLYKREIDIAGDVTEFEFKSDYNMLGNIIQPDHINKTISIKASANMDISINRYNPFHFTKIIAGLVTDVYNDNEIKYTFSLPNLSIDSTYNIRYRSVIAFVLYDSNMVEVNRYAMVDVGNFIDIDINGGAKFLGLIAEYSLFNSQLMVNEIVFNSEEVFPIIPYVDSDNINMLMGVTASSSMGFEITASYVYDSATKIDVMNVTSSASLLAEIGPTFDIKTVVVGDAIASGNTDPYLDECELGITAGMAGSFEIVL